MKRKVHTESEMVKAVQELESGIDAETAARNRFYDKMAAPCCGAPMSLEERKAMKRRLAEEYYDEDKK